MSEVRERPVLFSAPMRRGGSKTPSKLYAPRGVDPLSAEWLARRLLHGVTLINANGCWIWGRTAPGFGYGTMTVAGRARRVHRLALALSLGRDERSLSEVMHACDEPRCVNPEHLREGTHRENVRDMYVKGRARIHRFVPQRGTDNPAAKLNFEQVCAIREMRLQGATQLQIAERFGVSQQQVSSICLGRVRRHA